MHLIEKKSELINLLVAIVSHNRNSTTNSQGRPMASICLSRKSQNPMENKGFAPGTVLGYEFITIAKVRLNASCCFQIDTLAGVLVLFNHSRFSVSSALRTMRAALFFVLTQIVINMQATDGRKISRASVRLHA